MIVFFLLIALWGPSAFSAIYRARRTRQAAKAAHGAQLRRPVTESAMTTDEAIDLDLTWTALDDHQLRRFLTQSAP